MLAHILAWLWPGARLQTIVQMLAGQLGGRVLRFTDIEGSIAAEDYFLRCQIIDYSAADAPAFYRPVPRIAAKPCRHGCRPLLHPVQQ